MPCINCNINKAIIVRTPSSQKLCKQCFTLKFEEDVYKTMLFYSNQVNFINKTLVLAVSGGKDSSVLLHAIHKLCTAGNFKDLRINLELLSVDEGIEGYRADSLKVVEKYSELYNLKSYIKSYKEMYGMDMDDVMRNPKNKTKRSCTYCGVFRRKGLDEGTRELDSNFVLLGHNLDDTVETLLLNFVRGDLNRLGSSNSDNFNLFDNFNSKNSNLLKKEVNNEILRLKPLMNISEKDIVMYAFHNNLPYFSTECSYAPTAFRGFARIFIKKLERINSGCIKNLLKNSILIKSLLNNNKKKGGVVSDKCQCGYFKGINSKLCKACEFVEFLAD